MDAVYGPEDTDLVDRRPAVETVDLEERPGIVAGCCTCNSY